MNEHHFCVLGMPVSNVLDKLSIDKAVLEHVLDGRVGGVGSLGLGQEGGGQYVRNFGI